MTKIKLKTKASIQTKAYSRFPLSKGVKSRSFLLVQHASVRLVQTHPHGPILMVPPCPTDSASVAGTFIETLRILIFLSDVREGITAATPLISQTKVPHPHIGTVVIAPEIVSYTCSIMSLFSRTLLTIVVHSHQIFACGLMECLCL